MDTETALLAAINANPSDDLPRLVYADWLDENGEPERAEFIRVQCQLERVDPKRRTFFTEESERESLPPLHLREQHLWAEAVDSGKVFSWFPVFDHTFASAAGVAHLSRGNPDTYEMLGAIALVRRGFPHSVRLPLSLWVGRECHCVTMPNRGDGVCHTCSGYGRIFDIGTEVVRHHPVQVVTPTDKRPNNGGWWSRRDNRHSELPDHLPWAVFDLLEGGVRYAPSERMQERNPEATWLYDRIYPIDADAMSALSDAALLWAKSESLRPSPV